MIAVALTLSLAFTMATTQGDGEQPQPQSQSAQRIADKLVELRALFDQLECEKLIALAVTIEDHRLATKEERHEAMFRRGYCLVVIGNTGEADGLFRDVMREDIDAKPAFAIEPRVLALVESARSEIVKEKERAREEARRKLIEKIELQIGATPNVKGGNRVFFDVNIKDPDRVVKSMRVDFRKQGEREYYALPVTKKNEGWWRGEVPGTYTRSSAGMTLEWFLTLSDEAGEALKTHGARDAPNVLEVLPGSAIAEDLTASERVPEATRYVAGVAVTPFFTIVGSAAGVVVAVLLDTGITLAGFPGVANAVSGLALLTMPVALGSGMVFLVETTVLDAPASWLATGIVGGFLLLGEAMLLADWLGHPENNGAHVIGSALADGPPENPGEVTDDDANQNDPSTQLNARILVPMSAGAVIVGAIAGAIATPILIGLEAPGE